MSYVCEWSDLGGDTVGWIKFEPAGYEVAVDRAKLFAEPSNTKDALIRYFRETYSFVLDDHDIRELLPEALQHPEDLYGSDQDESLEEENDYPVSPPAPANSVVSEDENNSVIHTPANNNVTVSNRFDLTIDLGVIENNDISSTLNTVTASTILNSPTSTMVPGVA